MAQFDNISDVMAAISGNAAILATNAADVAFLLTGVMPAPARVADIASALAFNDAGRNGLFGVWQRNAADNAASLALMMMEV